MVNKKDWQPIIILNGEGGSIALLGMKTDDGQWIYRRSINEIFTLEDLADEPVNEMGSVKGVRTLKPTVKQSFEAGNWDDAKKIIEEYPLEFLGPSNVHPEFSQKLWALALTKKFEQHKLRRWAKACFPTISNEVFELFNQINESKHTVVLTGAGMSTEAGIPDFRSRSGWWNNIIPLHVATIEALENNYDLFHEFYSTRIKALETVEPHEGHYILANWQESRIIQKLATQNVDCLDLIAGTKDVDQLHGSLLSFRCHTCNAEVSKQQFLAKESCSVCNGKLRPNVTLFGEALPTKAWDNALHHIQKADLVIVIGTSLQVYPVSQLPKMTKGKTVYINKDVTEKDSYFTLIIEGSARETLMQVNNLLNPTTD
jgi:NAD-dependent SIR2 family protein deacetylase